MFFLVGLLGFSCFIFSAVSNWHIENTDNYMISVFFGAYLGFIILGIFLLFYTFWFVIASDSIAKTLGGNRFVFDLFNLVAIFTGLKFISIIVLYNKVKDILE